MNRALWNDLTSLSGHKIKQLVDQEWGGQGGHSTSRDVDQFSANGATEGSCVSGLRAGDVGKAFKAHRVRAGQQFWRVGSSVVDTCVNTPNTFSTHRNWKTFELYTGKWKKGCENFIKLKTSLRLINYCELFAFKRSRENKLSCKASSFEGFESETTLVCDAFRGSENKQLTRDKSHIIVGVKLISLCQKQGLVQNMPETGFMRWQLTRVLCSNKHPTFVFEISAS